MFSSSESTEIDVVNSAFSDPAGFREVLFEPAIGCRFKKGRWKYRHGHTVSQEEFTAGAEVEFLGGGALAGVPGDLGKGVIQGGKDNAQVFLGSLRASRYIDNQAVSPYSSHGPGKHGVGSFCQR